MTGALKRWLLRRWLDHLFNVPSVTAGSRDIAEGFACCERCGFHRLMDEIERRLP